MRLVRLRCAAPLGGERRLGIGEFGERVALDHRDRVILAPEGERCREAGDAAAHDDDRPRSTLSPTHGARHIPSRQIQLRSFSIIATGSAPTGVTLRCVTPTSARAATRSFRYGSGPQSEVASRSSEGTSAAASSFLPER